MPRRRKSYFINRRYQGRYAITFLALAALSAIVSTVALVHSISQQIEDYIRQPVLNISSSGEIILPIMLKVNGITFTVLLLVLVAISLLYHKYTARISRKVTDCIGRFCGGEFCEEMNVSAGKDFDGVESAFNTMMTSNRLKILALKELSREVEEDLDRLRSTQAGEPKEEALRALSEKLARMEEVLGTYRLE